MAVLTLGCFTEAISYIGRILLHFNAFSNAGFETQIVCLIIAPAFLSAGIYLTLKHFVLCFGEEYSRFPARFCTYIFTTADIFVLVLQATGGALAATSNSNITQRNEGNDFLMSGIVWQVFTLLVFFVLAAGHFFRLRISAKPLSMEAKAMKADLKFRLFQWVWSSPSAQSSPDVATELPRWLVDGGTQFSRTKQISADSTAA